VIKLGIAGHQVGSRRLIAKTGGPKSGTGNARCP
jgi:hypothetical protein